MASKWITFSVRLTSEEAKALQDRAASIGYGATVTGIIRQLIRDYLDGKGKS